MQPLLVRQKSLCHGLVALVCFLVACSGPSGGNDVVAMDAPETSVGDGAVDDITGDGDLMLCSADQDCTDGTFCNGSERCAPGTSGADSRGCVAASPATPCLAGQMCNESAQRCEASCGMTADADGDGHQATACGGDDCDDSDPNRFPGNPETCSVSDTHDEDCNAGTFGSLDSDGDGAIDARCCNTAMDGTAMCGTDCDDTRADTHPGATEVCDGVDTNCNGDLDGVNEDDDHDGHADSACAGAGASDCNDTNADIYVGAPELCDGMDNDCDGVADTTGDAGSGCASAQLALGYAHSCVKRVDGSVYCWGGNSYGQVGNGSRNNALTPVRVSLASATTIAAGYLNTCARVGTSLSCWGDNGSQQLGTGFTDSFSTRPVSNRDITDASRIAIGGGSGYRSLGGSPVFSTYAHICAIRSRGFSCWGGNGAGQLGDGTTTDRRTPVTPRGFTTASQVANGPSFTCAISGTTTRTLRCWGSNSYGQIGTGSSSSTVLIPATVTATNPVQVDTGAAHACAVVGTGTVSCWGDGHFGQLGNGQTGSGVMRSTPGSVSGITDAAQVAAGYGHTCVRRRVGEVVCWGDNQYGQLGNGTTSSATHPVAVTGLTDAVDIASGANHMCARRASGAIVCWGANASGQLGDGSTINRLVPTTVTLP